jgi:hypothetical protein
MSNDEAKFLLTAYRPGGHDAHDAALASALAQAERDPALRQWFEREQAHGAAVAAKLREIVPPAELRAAILAGAKASQPRGTGRPRWRRPLWLGVAASTVLLLTAAAWWQFVPVAGSSLEEFALNYVGHGFRLQKRDTDVAALQAWLAEQHRPLPQALPAGFAQLHALGCRTIDFEGRAISLICFERGGREFHVFIARRDEGGLPPPGEGTRGWRAQGNLVAAGWSDAANHYVVVTDAGRDALQRLL